MVTRFMIFHRSKLSHFERSCAPWHNLSAAAADLGKPGDAAGYGAFRPAVAPSKADFFSNNMGSREKFRLAESLHYVT